MLISKVLTLLAYGDFAAVAVSFLRNYHDLAVGLEVTLAGISESTQKYRRNFKH